MIWPFGTRLKTTSDFTPEEVANFDWDRLKAKLKDFEQDNLSHIDYPGTLAPKKVPRNFYFRLPENSLLGEDIAAVLAKAAIQVYQGLELLVPDPLPEIPSPPKYPKPRNRAQRTELAKLVAQIEGKCEERRLYFEKKLSADRKLLDRLSTRLQADDYCYVIPRLALLSFARHPLHPSIRGEASVYYDETSRVVLCEFVVPDFDRLTIAKERSSRTYGEWVSVSPKEKVKLCGQLLHALCVRQAYLVARSDPAAQVDLIAVNAHQSWVDKATGNTKSGIIASLQSTKEQLLSLQPWNLDPTACFRHLKGLVTPSLENVSIIRPILTLDTSDSRIVQNRDVAQDLNEGTNLASMPWEDFEHLVRQLLEWEFGSQGIEVKVTQASRDRGVDAIMFDPDPLRGGKYVVQAKRYTRTVDVAAVRDLFGTVLNEGANRGILVTTSSFGPDSYEFAKDKPISLVDGANLVSLCSKHGRNYRISLKETRQIEILRSDGRPRGNQEI